MRVDSTIMHEETLPQLGNEHGAVAPHDRNERRTRLVVAVAAAMMVLELIVGRWANSEALTADGWHMATHAGALGLAALAYWFARTHANHEAFSFGTGKVYALAGYSSAISLAFVALWIIADSIGRFVAPKPIRFAEALPVAVLGLAVNLVSAWLLDHDHGDDPDHAHAHDGHSHGGEAHDHNLRAAYIHVLADAFTSVLAISALLAARYLGWTFLDPVMGIIGGVVITHWSIGLCRSSARQLLDAAPDHEMGSAIRALLEAIDDVRVVDLHLWEMAPGRRGCIVSLVTSQPRETGYYRGAILKSARLAHLTVEVHRCAHGHDESRRTAS
jgi:cation diffusion facilitator family transporter